MVRVLYIFLFIFFLWKWHVSSLKPIFFIFSSFFLWNTLEKDGLRKEVSEGPHWECAPHSVHWLLHLFYDQKINSSHILHQSWRTPGLHEVPGCLAWQQRDFIASFLHLLESGADWGLPFWKITSRICVWGTSCFSVTQDIGTSQDFNFSYYFIFPFLLCWNSIEAWKFSSTLMLLLAHSFPPSFLLEQKDGIKSA